MPMEYILLSLIISIVVNRVDIDIMEERLEQFFALGEDQFIARFHQQV